MIPPVGTAEQVGDQVGRSSARWGGYLYFQANCGDVDLIGQPKPQNRWHAAVSGRSPVEVTMVTPDAVVAVRFAVDGQALAILRPASLTLPVRKVEFLSSP